METFSTLAITWSTNGPKSRAFALASSASVNRPSVAATSAASALQVGHSTRWAASARESSADSSPSREPIMGASRRQAVIRYSSSPLVLPTSVPLRSTSVPFAWSTGVIPVYDLSAACIFFRAWKRRLMTVPL